MTHDDLLAYPGVEVVAKAIRDSECGTGSTEPWEEYADDAYAAIRAIGGEAEKLRAKLAGIEAALKKRGLFAFEHIDGTFTINDR